ncbi:MAG TPA: cytochrome c [Candidatus Dormibacteraeota bacterium]|nr:cytochrome c [Candidatus Dormibacteraeota bacterium]
MRFSKLLAATAVLAASAAAQAQMPSYKNVGRTPTKQQIQAWDISIGPDGKGLPAGSGTAAQGAPIYAAKCAVCHGADAQGGKIGPELAADKAAFKTLTTLKPVRVVSTYWPYATMVWDYINRAMPRNQGGTLTANQVYALTAFILYKGSIIRESDVMDARALPKVQMPNRNGFVPARFSDIPDEHKRGCRQGICP